MTTFTIDENTPFITTHFRSVKDLYETLRIQYEFEDALENSAEKAMNTPYSDLVNI